MAETSESDDEALDAAIAQVAADGVIRARGLQLTARQLDALLDAAPHSEETGRPILGRADFSHATFSEEADFSHATFSEEALFNVATFSKGALFSKTTFSGNVEFNLTTFSGGAAFGEATFGGDVEFDGAMFGQKASFDRATFRQDASFTATFGGDASFSEATFKGGAWFEKAIFSQGARLPSATFAARASFTEAAFSGEGDFSKAAFGEDANFEKATFRREANFNEGRFSGDANFIEATFGRKALFHGSEFGGNASFGMATFSREAEFRGSKFGGEAWFGEATLSGDAVFTGSKFSGPAIFGPRFGGNAWFSHATFAQTPSFIATVDGKISFDGATFEQATDLWQLFVGAELVLDQAAFAKPLKIEVTALRVSCVRTVFAAGADLFVRWADVTLEDADFAGQSLVSGLPPLDVARAQGSIILEWEELSEWLDRPGNVALDPSGQDEGAAMDLRRKFETEAPSARYTARVVSLRRAKVAKLTLSDLDLSACRFAGAHGLDGLRLDRARFADPPAGWHTSPAGWRGRYTHRLTVAEEHLWRRQGADRSALVHPLHGNKWYDDDVRAPDWLPEGTEALDPQQIAAIYRALRKGHEDSKDEPGAGGFYYGEMEMRRHSGPLAERAILWLYWAVSGYGLRASRALIALAITIVLGAFLLQQFGFDTGDRPDEGLLLFAVESSISLFRPPEAALTPAGHVIQIVLRLAGPLFFGLALLALRGRVKR